MCFSVALSIFILFCNHYHHPSPKLFQKIVEFGAVCEFLFSIVSLLFVYSDIQKLMELSKMSLVGAKNKSIIFFLYQTFKGKDVVSDRYCYIIS